MLSLSFSILNSCDHTKGFPIHTQFTPAGTPEETQKIILDKLQELLLPLRNQLNPDYDSTKDKIYDVSNYFNQSWFDNQYHPYCSGDIPYIEIIAESLARLGQFSENYVHKYYSIAFAVNKQRFPVSAKGCETTMIKWDQDTDDLPYPHPGSSQKQAGDCTNQ